jgi:hypothetical protein
MQGRTLVIAGLALVGGFLVLTTVTLVDPGSDHQGSDPRAVSSAGRLATGESGPDGESGLEEAGAPAVQPRTAGSVAQAAREGGERRGLPRRRVGPTGGKDAREGKPPRSDENQVGSAPAVVGGGDGEPRAEIAIDSAQTLNEIATLLTSETAWLNGPESGPVSDAIAGLAQHESLSENALRDAIGQVLDRGASMLLANDDAEGAELALAAQEAMAEGQFGVAVEIVWDIVSWYPTSAGEPGA